MENLRMGHKLIYRKYNEKLNDFLVDLDFKNKELTNKFLRKNPDVFCIIEECIDQELYRSLFYNPLLSDYDIRQTDWFANSTKDKIVHRFRYRINELLFESIQLRDISELIYNVVKTAQTEIFSTLKNLETPKNTIECSNSGIIIMQSELDNDDLQIGYYYYMDYAFNNY